MNLAGFCASAVTSGANEDAVDDGAEMGAASAPVSALAIIGGEPFLPSHRSSGLRGRTERERPHFIDEVINALAVSGLERLGANACRRPIGQRPRRAAE